MDIVNSDFDWELNFAAIKAPILYATYEEYAARNYLELRFSAAKLSRICHAFEWGRDLNALFPN